jgi:Flp pilus assembly protein TadB
MTPNVAKITLQLKRNHKLMVQMDDEITRLNARRAELEQQSDLLHAMLSNSSNEAKTGSNTLDLRSEFVLLFALMILVLALLYLGSWAALVISAVGTLGVVTALRRRRRNTILHPS